MPKLKLICLCIALVLIIAGCNPADNREPVPTESGQSTEDPSPSIGDSQPETEIKGLIHVNQLGYRCDDKKIAVILEAAQSDSFQVVALDDNEVVYTGTLPEKTKQDKSSGDTLRHADFSEVKEPGDYYIAVPGAGRSYQFTISDDVYNDLNDALLKVMYFQRCGIALEEKYAGEWAHAACHTADGTHFEDRDMISDTTGGWHDAGDYGKYTVPAAVTAAEMLIAYELFPTAFEADINIPESGNDIPDILDEALFALKWMLKMQDSDTGGVYHKVSTNSFPGFIMPERDNGIRYINPVSPTATGSFAAVMALSSRIFKDYDPDYSEQALAAAQKAWGWLKANPDAQGFKNPVGVSTGEYGDSNSSDERWWAAVELYKATGDEEYHTYVKDSYKKGFSLTALGWVDNGGFGTIAYLFMDEASRDAQVYDSLRSTYLKEAENILLKARYDGYKVAMYSTEYNWGSNMTVMNRGIIMIIANLLESNAEYEQTAIDQLHYLLGRNALSQSYVTGFGSKPVMHPHHRPSGADGVTDPVPGMVAGGPNSALEDPDAKRLVKSGTPPAKCFVDVEGSYSTNEMTTYWNSPALVVTAYFTQNN